MPAGLIFYYDVVCPYAYLGATQVEALAARTGAALTWVPILLGGVFRAIGSPDVPAEHMPPAKAVHNLLDIRRQAALLAVPIDFPPPGHPRRSVEAMRLLHVVDGADRVRLSHALYRAYFVEHRVPQERATLEGACAAAGLDPSLVAGIERPEIKEALRRATDAAIADGVFGVPGFVVVKGAQRTLYWGVDRIHLVEREIAA